jgi:hypothetical protein
MTSNKTRIKLLVKSMLRESNKNMLRDLDRILKSSANSTGDLDDDTISTILPKSILKIILHNESKQHSAKNRRETSSLYNLKNSLIRK